MSSLLIKKLTMSILFYNAKVFLENGISPELNSVYVEGNKIKYVDQLSNIKTKVPSSAEKIDLQQKIILPGLIDTHTHFVQYALSKSEVDLSAATSLEQIRKILLKFKDKMPKNQKWVSGKEWNGNKIKNKSKLDRKFLDKIFPHTPVSLSSKDLHTFICNSKALEKMNLEEENLPEGSSFGYYSDGRLNGILQERAWLLIDEVKPQLSDKIKKQLVTETIAKAHKFGLTGIHIMEEKSSYDLLQNLEDENKLQLRVCWHFPLDLLDDMIDKGIKSYTDDEWMKIGGVKIFMDGSIGSETAYMFHSYKENPEKFGNLINSEKEYYDLILKAGLNGISPTTHSIGDKSNYYVVNAIIKLLNNPKIKSRQIFPRIEHFQIARPQEQKKVAKHKIYCAMQPAHISLDAVATEKKVGKYGKNSYPFNSLLGMGAKIGFGSDVPVSSFNPFLGIYAAIERKYEYDPANYSWIPEEKISPEQAIRAYTLEAAFGSQEHNLRGSIQEGKLADLIVVEDYTKYNSAFWLNASSLLTMINGKIVQSQL